MILLGLAGFKLAGKFLKHVLGLLILGWQRMLRASAIAALIGIIGTEVLACFATGRFPPPLLAQLVAAALALALAYGAALTVLLYELFAGTLDTIHMLMGDAEAETRAASATVEHEAGNVRDTLRRLIGLPVKSLTAASAVAAVTLPTLAIRSGRGRRPTVPKREDTDVDAGLAPPHPPKVTALPVPASKLPRIAWTYDEPIHASPPLSEPPPQPAARPMSPATSKHEEIAAPAVRAMPEEGKLDLLASMDEDTLKRRIASSAATPQPSRALAEIAPKPERTQPRPTRPLGSTTWPLGSTTRPLGRVTRPLTDSGRLHETTNSGGLWERLSQALVGPIEEPSGREEAETLSTSPNATTSPEAEHDS
jgi:hypothetical protein